MRAEILAKLQEARAAKRPVALATNLRSGEQKLIFKDGAEGGLCLDVDMTMAAQDMLARDESGTLQTGLGPVFVHVHNPPPRLIVVGAVHIAEPLVRMGAMAGYGVALIDPRRAFAASQSFEGLSVSTDWPDDAMAALKPDVRSAIVTLTHDPKIDDPALEAALNSPAFYIGALGSRKTHAARLARLKERGFDDTALARIKGPVGLDIGALSPAEIAVSIVAQIVQTRRNP
jgi:xanthine dehydrogenase accessory factor